MYQVALGNHRVLYFASTRHALQCQADASRFLSDQVAEVNLLLCDAFVAYRMAWPYLGGAGTAKAIQEADQRAAACVRDAELALGRAVADAQGPNAVFHQWRAIERAAIAVRDVATTLEGFYVTKTMGAQRVQLAILARRADAVVKALAEYGADVDTAKASRARP